MKEICDGCNNTTICTFYDSTSRRIRGRIDCHKSRIDIRHEYLSQYKRLGVIRCGWCLHFEPGKRDKTGGNCNALNGWFRSTQHRRYCIKYQPIEHGPWVQHVR
jgi:hypothetical protein